MLTRICAALSRRLRTRWERARYARFQSGLSQQLDFTEAVQRYPDRNALYAYMHHCLHHSCPQVARQHRDYFSQQDRGFGEDALHSMWWLIFREFRPGVCLEIGVYRGQVISLWSLLAQQIGFVCDVHGISPFEPIGDAVSNYREDIDYLTDTLASFQRFELPSPTLVRAFSTNELALTHIRKTAWDLIYIDGSHDYEIVLADYNVCRASLAPGGLLVLDDSSLGTDFSPPSFSFAGHDGPSQVAVKHAMRDLNYLGAVGHNSVFQKPPWQGVSAA